MKPSTNTGNLPTTTSPRLTLRPVCSRFTYHTASHSTMIGRNSTRVILKISATLRVSMPVGWEGRPGPPTRAQPPPPPKTAREHAGHGVREVATRTHPQHHAHRAEHEEADQHHRQL